MDKNRQAFRSITEVAKTLELPSHVLRFWETKFTQIEPVKRAGGRRYYRPEDIDLICRIKTLLYEEGYTIRGVQQLLKEEKNPRKDVLCHQENTQKSSAAPAPDNARLLAELKNIRSIIANILKTE